MIYPASQAVSSIFIGAQDCHLSVSGAHTGCLSAEMLQAAGARTIIAGHSERRTDQHERHEDVAAKASAAHGQSLNVILCVGEQEAQRDAGDDERVVPDQLLAALPENAAVAWLCTGESRV